ncbi:hypothetical protein [Paraburkholderia guartelaensis]|uniref:hypothetical protein n=1 Tax=Paraburkholderia guartelaensis TaxID=2546446 RepID=UPI002AB7EA5B|nr:hypothetical protein [Paraburkholderia guartelaensis]
MKQTSKHMTFFGSVSLLAALPLMMAACSKSATPDVAAHTATASTASTVIASSSGAPTSAPSSAAASLPTASDSGVTSEKANSDANADEQEADESGTAVGTVTVSGLGGDRIAETPFGKLSESDDNVLLLDGKPVSPQIQGNNSLSFIAQVALKNRRAVLVQDNGGTACPAMFRWVTLRDDGYTVSNWFGSCSDLAKVSAAAGKLIVTMPDFVGDAAPEAEQKRVARRKMTYVYDGKNLTENGKPYVGSATVGT